MLEWTPSFFVSCVRISQTTPPPTKINGFDQPRDTMNYLRFVLSFSSSVINIESINDKNVKNEPKSSSSNRILDDQSVSRWLGVQLHPSPSAPTLKLVSSFSREGRMKEFYRASWVVSAISILFYGPKLEKRTRETVLQFLPLERGTYLLNEFPPFWS